MDTLDTDGIATSQTPASGGAQNLTLDGVLSTAGIATLDIPRRVGIASVGDDTARTFTITGTDRFGNTISDAIAGTNASTAESVLDFKTVTQIQTDDDTAAAVEAGTTGTASSQIIEMDYNGSSKATVEVLFSPLSSTNLTYDVEDTNEDTTKVNATGEREFQWFNHSVLNGKTAPDKSSYAHLPRSVRLTVRNYVAGQAELIILQTI